MWEIILARREVEILGDYDRPEITTDRDENSTWYVMTEIPGLNYKDVGNLYGCRNWVEYGLNQSKTNWDGQTFADSHQDIEKVGDSF